MSDLPPGWATTRLDHCSENLDSCRVPVNSSERASREGDVPYYGATGRVGWIDRPLFNEELVLLGEDGAPFFERHRPKAYLINGPSWVNNHAHVLRGRGVSNRYLKHFLNSIDYHGLANGTTRLKLTQASMNSIAVHVAPLHEQERIVAAVEGQFSRLDAGVAALERVRSRVEQLARAVVVAAIPGDMPTNWTLTTVGEAGQVQLGRQRSPKFHDGPNMRPYLRVANVFEDRIDSSDVMTMHFSESEFRHYELRPGDVLLNEGQSPHLLGRPAMYRGDPPSVAFTNSLLRFRAKDGILPSWALLVFRRHLHVRRFMAESQITTNIAHLSAGRFKTIEFPVPPIEEQRRIIASVDEQLSSVAFQRSSAERSLARAGHLRSSILSAAFSGKLVPQDPSHEPASVLLERIAAERSKSNGLKPARVHKQRTTHPKVLA